MLKLKNIVKDYPLGQVGVVHALKNISVTLEDKGFVSILGPSGCGKTTLLNIIGGLDQYSDGDLIINGVSTKNYKDGDWDLYRNVKIGFVFQSYNLIQHLTIEENVEMPLVLNGETAAARREKAVDALRKVGLENQLKKKPNQLSGGQQQRVAIARALVNNPEIILADEPTGALDTETSVQVMELLQEVAKERLVIMVTHNDNLAKEYSTRIISMLDGEIVSDTNRTDLKDDSKKKITGKTSMTFATSYKLAMRNIMTKKGRTALLTVASSVGIIGVGLVLSLSNGFQNYIGKVEEATASSAPITYSPVIYSYKDNPNKVEYEQYPDEQEIKVYDQSTQGPTTIEYHNNTFTEEFFTYVNNISSDKKAKNSLASMLINYTDPKYFIVGESDNGSSYKLVNNNASTSNVVQSVVSQFTGTTNTIMREFSGDKDYILNAYDVIYGSYPETEGIDTNGDGEPDVFEMSLIVDQYNRVDKSTLIQLGLFSESNAPETINFSDFVGKTFKFYQNDDVYFSHGTTSIENLKVNGVDDYPNDTLVQSYQPETVINLPSDASINLPLINKKVEKLVYPEHSLYQYYDYSDNQNLLKELYNNNFSLNSNAKPVELKITSVLRTKEDTLMDLMPISVCYPKSFKDFAKRVNDNSEISVKTKQNLAYTDKAYLIEEFNDAVRNGAYNIDISNNNVMLAFNNLMTGMNKLYACYSPYAIGSRNSVNQKIEYSANKQAAVNGYGNFLKRLYGLGAEISMEDTGDVWLAQTYKKVMAGDTSATVAFMSQFINFMINNGAFDSGFNETNAIALSGLFNTMASSINNVKEITSVLIYAKNLTEKVNLLEYLDNYNVGKAKEHQLIYSDVVGTITDNLTQMIDIISVVLIVFAAISLFVSCVMTAIITYNSVIERTKEIGILRAVGARKKDISRMFNSEAITIGTMSGVFGVLMVIILQFPVNIILNAVFPDYGIGNIADIAWYAGIILVVISALLSFLAGLVPSRMAAKKDPVVALRTE